MRKMGDQDHKLKEINTVQPPWPSFDLSPLAKKKVRLDTENPN